ncbi:MAG: Stress response protein nst1 [Watsoniomyces obsoletus]|nr:MAG: Stress response protein nst1 [Watsoniomyces obsoletus]
MSGIVPTTDSLAEIYLEEDLEAQRPRWERLGSSFEQRYGRRPQYVSRSPGRVNLIGEHIDYSLYEVMPMAISLDILLAVAVTPLDHSDSHQSVPQIKIANINATKFQDRQFEIPLQGDIDIDASTHEWSNYFKAGLRGGLEWLRRRRGSEEHWTPVGMDILVDGSVPEGAGLSSSSALVCASALAVLKANGQESVDQKGLVQLAMVSERAVGVNSGGYVGSMA